MSLRNPGGRPPKYNEPSRPVTVTLPESVLRILERINVDRGQAIVQLARQYVSDSSRVSRVEIIEVGGNCGLIVIGPCEALRHLAFLQLVEVAPSRFLLALDRRQDFRSLELAIHDLLEGTDAISGADQALLKELLATIRMLRRAERVSQAEILLVNMGKSASENPGPPSGVKLE